jgi:hypothetical protein
MTRRFQFSLGQLMVGTALICAAAAFWRQWLRFYREPIWLYMLLIASLGAIGFMSGRIRILTLVGNIICGLVLIGAAMAASRFR